jgi:hypothetical protein
MFKNNLGTSIRFLISRYYWMSRNITSYAENLNCPLCLANENIFLNMCPQQVLKHFNVKTSVRIMNYQMPADCS